MPQQLKFGVITIQNVPWQEMVRRWRYIEDLGFSSVWVADHFLNSRAPAKDWLEGWTLLAALATQTSTIRIGTLVTQIPLRHPALLARQALTVDHISGGRLDLGLGTGTIGDLGNLMMGLENWPAAERVARFQEAVEIICTMLKDEVTTYEGRYYQVRGAVMNPRPVQQPRPPITIAAMGPAMLKIAAKYADTWNTFGAFGVSPRESAEVVRERGEMLDELCRQVGRDPTEISRSILAYGKVEGTNPFVSADAFQEYVALYREAGINEFIFYYPPQEFYQPATAEQEEVFERVAREIIPGLSSLR